MSVEPISIRQMEKQTSDVYEAVVVMFQRARQISQHRAAERALYEMEEMVGDGMDMDMEMEQEEETIGYQEKEKPATIAIGEFMEGQLAWHSAESEDIG